MAIRLRLIVNKLLYFEHAMKRGTRKSSSDFVLITAGTELLIGDRKSNVSFFNGYTVRMESDYDWSRCIS
jgi:hypothetical protein